MKKHVLQKMVRQEVRRALKPTGLVGKRGPAKNIPVLVRRQVESSVQPCPVHYIGQGLGMSE